MAHLQMLARGLPPSYTHSDRTTSMNSPVVRDDDTSNIMDAESTQHPTETDRSTHVQTGSVWQPNPVLSYSQITVPGLNINATSFIYPVAPPHDPMDAEFPPEEATTEPMNVEYWEQQMEDAPSPLGSPKTPPQRASQTSSASMNIPPPGQKWRSPSKATAASAYDYSDDEEDAFVSEKRLPPQPTSPTMIHARQHVSMNLASKLASLKVSPAADTQRSHAKSGTAAARSTSLKSSPQLDDLPTARAGKQSSARIVNMSSANAERPTMTESHASSANSTSPESVVKSPSSNSAASFTHTPSPTSTTTTTTTITTTMPAKTTGSRRDRKEKKLAAKKEEEEEKEKMKKEEVAEGKEEEEEVVAVASPAKPAEGAGLSREVLPGHLDRRPGCIRELERGIVCLPGINNYGEWARVQRHKYMQRHKQQPSPAELTQYCVEIVESRWREYDSKMGKGPFSWTDHDPLEGQEYLAPRQSDKSKEVDVSQTTNAAGSYDASLKELNDAIAQHEADLDANNATDATKLRAHIKALTHRHDMNEDKLLELHVKLRDAQDLAHRYANHITDLESKQESANQQLAEHSKTDSQRAKAADNNEKYIEDLGNKLESLQKRYDELSATQKQTAQDLSTTRNEAHSAKTTKETTQHDLDNSRKQNSELSGENDDLKKEIKGFKALAQQHDDLNTQLETAKQVARENVELYEGYALRLKELLGAPETDEPKPIEAIITELEAVYQSRMWADNATVHGQTLDKELEDSGSVKESDDTAELEKQLHDTTEQLNSKTLELSKLQADSLSREAQNAQTISQLQTDLNTTKSELEVQKKDHESNLSKQSLQLSDLTQKLKVVQKELDQANIHHLAADKEKASTFSKLNDDLLSMTGERNDKTALLDKHIMDSKKAQENLNESSRKVELALEQEKQRTISLELDLKTAVGQANVAKSKLDEATKAHKADQKTAQTLTDNNAKSQKEWKAKESDLQAIIKRTDDELKRQRDQRRSQEETYKAKVSSSKAELQLKVNEHNSLIKTLKNDHATELERLKKESTKVQDTATGQLNRAQTEHAQAIERNETSLKVCRKQLQESSDQMKQFAAKNNDLDTKLIEAQDNCKQLASKVDHLQEQLEQANSQLAKTKEHGPALLKAHEDFEQVNLKSATSELSAARLAQSVPAKNVTVDKSSGTDLAMATADVQLILPPQPAKTSLGLDLSYFWMMLLLLFAIPCLKLGIDLWTSSLQQCDLSTCWIQRIPPLDYVQSWLDVDCMMYG